VNIIFITPVLRSVFVCLFLRYKFDFVLEIRSRKVWGYPFVLSRPFVHSPSSLWGLPHLDPVASALNKDYRLYGLFLPVGNTHMKQNLSLRELVPESTLISSDAILV
jgi:hypothetical protein